jgi:hypothetical protein
MVAMPAEESKLQQLSQRFRVFAEHECHDSSPLYETLSLRISEDRDLLELASKSSHRPVPNLLFAAVHYLLLKGDNHPLSRFYPDIAESRSGLDGAYQQFKSFCLEKTEEITKLIQSRLVQTNEVRRSALLLPAFEQVAAASSEPLQLIEIGSAAGLNLLWNHYSYDYGTGVVYGDEASSVRIHCEVRGGTRPPLSNGFPDVGTALGIDLNTLDVHNEDDCLWLQALVWPEHKRRMGLLKSAIQEAGKYRLDLRKGDAIELLPGILSSSGDSAKCVFSTFTLNQFSELSRGRLWDILAKSSEQGDVYLVSAEWFAVHGSGEHPELVMATFRRGLREDKQLAYCDAHGEWIQWIQSGDQVSGRR